MSGTGSPAAETPKPRMVTYVFPLRRDLMIELALPADLTARDVARIRRWIETMPDEDER